MYLPFSVFFRLDLVGSNKKTSSASAEDEKTRGTTSIYRQSGLKAL